ncbi:Orotidine 5'-phosphate decarboxylase [Pseudovirgaria hyperparasitica]|uniref:Orotidine 5'-phosphate decarboxylase n=1 Tax=Pseudovirgaria hyperparasitica TaxID=470096 RepID=A0A6A6W456_9PEZI|nr:Orotidine 5'-phosphate decarboxylase [Pseudovirgaria hyperparasitica]KAF2756814.1 Orotidine 5'-phosphate decarboxylase [Pseudovirgaria hyperparasitica]
MDSPVRHTTWTQSYRERASLPQTSALTSYLLRLISIKRTNLCVSADVTTTAELLQLAEDVGDSICMLKTHCDIVGDWGERTVRGLRAIARRKRFLIFEDRKFADIGETVRKQYTGGPFRIARWSEITNAHILPGPNIITSLKLGASQAINAHKAGVVQTEISADPPPDDWHIDDGDDIEEVSPTSTTMPPDTDSHMSDENGKSSSLHLNPDSSADFVYSPIFSSYNRAATGRKASVVSISTTISTRTESISPFPTPEENEDSNLFSDPLIRVGDAPFERGLLLLAEMSSEGHLLTGSYTSQCASLAREHRDFVIGFIAQRSLNVEPGDNFLTMTPGVQLPAEDAMDTNQKLGDQQGQQYNSPRKIVYEQGCDIVIVGRGILKAADRSHEAERYRREAWDAYEDRIGIGCGGSS